MFGFLQSKKFRNPLLLTYRNNVISHRKIKNVSVNCPDKGIHPSNGIQPSYFVIAIGVDSVQKYIQVGELQLIILSDSDWICSGDVQVTGILKEIDMGGPEGTRGSYRNYYISKVNSMFIVNVSQK